MDEPDAAEESSPFKRFEDFARRIVAVPKRELDEKLAQHNAAKQGNNGPGVR